jgi:hypothetical protein
MTFVKGQSGNPGGRPKAVLPDGRTLAELARDHTEAAIETLIDVMTNVEQPAAARVTAANSILDRGWGKAPQPIVGDDEAPAVKLDVTGLTNEQLAALEAIGSPTA